MPVNSHQKIDRRALPPPEFARAAIGRGSYVAPRTPMESLLADLWAKTLGLKQVGIHDDFFALGGDSLLAVRLFVQIEKAVGKQLPLASLLKATTVEQLAARLGEETATDWSSLVEMQPRGSKLPFFCVHGADGNVFCFRSLSQYLGFDRPFWGLQSEGLDGKPLTLLSVEAIASHYVQAMRSVQPEGPYCLGGFSSGGIIAFEMAQQLSAQGQEVVRLVLLDSWLDRPQDTPEARLHLHLEQFKQSGMVYLLQRLQHRLNHEIGSWVDTLSRLTYQFYLRRGRLVPIALRSIYMQDVTEQIVQNYVPKTYTGHVVLFYSEEHRQALANERYQLTWDQLAVGQLEIAHIPGKHVDIVKEPHVKVLAKKLRFYLEQIDH